MGGQKGAREGKEGAREGKKGAAPFYFSLAGTLFWIFVGLGFFVIGLNQISSFFLDILFK